MKAVTEFASFTLNKALAAQAALVTAGKTPEEIQQSLGETFKLEGEKLGYFMNALEVAGKNSEKLMRVVIMRLNDGETQPVQATKFEELYYIPEFFMLTQPKPMQAPGKGGRRGGGGDRGPKSSPWGMSPEEKAAKNQKKNAAPKAT